MHGLQDDLFDAYKDAVENGAWQLQWGCSRGRTSNAEKTKRCDCSFKLIARHDPVDPGMLSFSTVAWHSGHDASDASGLKLSPELCLQIESDLRKGLKPYRILDVVNAAQDREDEVAGRCAAASYNNSRL